MKKEEVQEVNEEILQLAFEEGVDKPVQEGVSSDEAEQELEEVLQKTQREIDDAVVIEEIPTPKEGDKKTREEEVGLDSDVYMVVEPDTVLPKKKLTKREQEQMRELEQFPILPDTALPAINDREKETFQSWQLTKVKYAFSLCEKNIFLKVVEICQKFLEKKDLGSNCYMKIHDTMMSGKVPVIMFPIQDIIGKGGKNYEWVKQGLKSMLKKNFGVPGIKGWEYVDCVLFQRVMADKSTGRVGVILSIDFWRAFCNLESYKIINTEVAMSFKSIYTERIYELLIGNEGSITYGVENLKNMFCLEDKYKNNGHFIKKVIDVAHDEMRDSEKCPIMFEYEAIKGERRKIIKIEFKIVHKNANTEPTEKEKKLMKLRELTSCVKLSEAVTQMVREYYPEIVLTREDVILKLKVAQMSLGVNELVDQIAKIHLVGLNQMDKGKLKSSQAAYLFGSLEKIVRAKNEEEKAKHTYHEPEKPKDDGVYPFKRVNIGKDPLLNHIGEDDKYRYFVKEYVENFAKNAGQSVEEWSKKWGFEPTEGGYWRYSKDREA